MMYRLRGEEGSIGQRPTVPGAVEISNNSAETNSGGNRHYDRTTKNNSKRPVNHVFPG